MDSPRARRHGLAVGALALAAAVTGAPAHGSVVLAESATVYAQQTNNYSFSAPGAGTLDVTLTDLDFSEPLSSLGMSLSSASTTLGTLSTGGSFLVPITGPLALSAFVTADANPAGPLDLGGYSLNISFTPLSSPVPLPAAGFLFLGGVGLLASMAWSKREAARNESVMCSA
jgi:hypothetical protein